MFFIYNHNFLYVKPSKSVYTIDLKQKKKNRNTSKTVYIRIHSSFLHGKLSDFPLIRRHIWNPTVSGVNTPPSIQYYGSTPRKRHAKNTTAPSTISRAECGKAYRRVRGSLAGKKSEKARTKASWENWKPLQPSLGDPRGVVRGLVRGCVRGFLAEHMCVSVHLYVCYERKLPKPCVDNLARESRLLPLLVGSICIRECWKMWGLFSYYSWVWVKFIHLKIIWKLL